MKLDLKMADEIARSIIYRQEHFEDEDLTTSIKVVLFNFGDRYKFAHCTSPRAVCGWMGPKSTLAKKPSGLPCCPTCGNVCTEDQSGYHFELVHDG